jgi:hypothetical protein
MMDWDALVEANDSMTEEIGIATSIFRDVAVTPLWSGNARWEPRRAQSGFDSPNASTDLQSFWIVTLPSSATLVPLLGDRVQSERRTTRIVRTFDRAGENWIVPEILVAAEEVSRSATMIVLSRRNTSGVVVQLPAQAFVVALQATRPAQRSGFTGIDNGPSGEMATVTGTLRGAPDADILPGDRFPFEGRWGRVDTVRVTSDGTAVEANVTINYGSV